MATIEVTPAINYLADSILNGNNCNKTIHLNIFRYVCKKLPNFLFSYLWSNRLYRLTLIWIQDLYFLMLFGKNKRAEYSSTEFCY